MANVDNPNGFRVYRGEDQAIMPLFARDLKADTGCIKGDPLYVDGSGDLVVATASSAVLGVAVHTVVAPTDGSQEKVLIYPARKDIVFHAQCSGSYTAAAKDFIYLADIEGSTGIFEINEDASSVDVVMILGLSPIPRGNVAGANARVLVRIAKSQYEQAVAA